MMDVGLVTPRYPPNHAGGGEQSARLLAEHLSDSARVGDVTVLSFDGHSSTRSGDVEIRRLRRHSSLVTEVQNLRALGSLREQLESFDVVHAYNMELNPVVGYRCSVQSIPSVATLNSYHFIRAREVNRVPGALERVYEIVGYPTTGRVLRHFQGKIDRYIAISDSIKEKHRSIGIPLDRTSVIPNMYDPSFEPPDSTRDLNDHSLLYVGELSRGKGVQHLIHALGELDESYELRLVGSGPHEMEFRTLAADLGVDDRISFSGQVPYEEIADVYAGASVFVHPGVRPEPFGRTLLEAMQSGLPVVCTDVGAPPDIVLDGELVCEPGNPTALASAIERVPSVARDPAAYRRYVEDSFDPATITSSVVDVYDELLSEDYPERC